MSGGGFFPGAPRVLEFAIALAEGDLERLVVSL